jgi:hypothetical protein
MSTTSIIPSDPIVEMHGEMEVIEPVEVPEVKAEEPTEKTPEQIEADKTAEIEQDKKKKQNHAARRWEKMIRESERARAEADMLREENERLKGATQTNATNTRPSRNQFNTDEDFNNAVMDWVENKTARVTAQATAEAQRVHEEKEVSSTWKAREDELRKNHSDYDDVISDASDVVIPPVAVDAILSSEHGPELRYYLAQNPDTAEKLNHMVPIAAIREICKIEARFEAEKTVAKPPVKTSAAPDPIKPIGGRGSAEQKDVNKMTPTEYMAWRNNPKNAIKFKN